MLDDKLRRGVESAVRLPSADVPSLAKVKVDPISQFTDQSIRNSHPADTSSGVAAAREMVPEEGFEPSRSCGHRILSRIKKGRIK